MKRKMKSFVAAFAATTILLGAMPSVAWADGKVYSEQAGGTTPLKKVLEIDNDTNIPAATFNFKITAGTAQDSEDYDALDVNAGLNPELVKINGTAETGTIVFAAGGTKTSPGTGITVTDSTTSGKYLATKTVDLDFSAVKFKEPGIYRYIITENATTGAAGISNDTTTTRTVDVYVEDNGSGVLTVAGYIMYKGTVDAAPAPKEEAGTKSDFTGEDNSIVTNGKEMSAAPSGAEKSVGFINTYTTHDIEFSKTVTGNQGSRDKYFEFTVKVTGDFDDAQVFQLDDSSSQSKDPSVTALADATAVAAIKTANNVTSVTGAELKAGKVFYLQSGQKIKINGIPEGVSYTVTEDAEDYDPSVALTKTTGYDYENSNEDEIAGESAATGTKYSITDDSIEGDVKADFTNTKSGVLPTGIIMSVAPAVGLVLAGLAAAFAVVLGGKRRKEELEEE